MTTPAAEQLYLAQHLHQFEGARNTIFNPHDRPIDELPLIMGFNNGGSECFYHAVAIAEDGTALAGHACSHPGYMPHDLCIIEGSTMGKYQAYEAHYPDGYRAVFVADDEIETHEKLQRAIRLNAELAAKETKQ